MRKLLISIFFLIHFPSPHVLLILTIPAIPHCLFHPLILPSSPMDFLYSLFVISITNRTLYSIFSRILLEMENSDGGARDIENFNFLFFYVSFSFAPSVFYSHISHRFLNIVINFTLFPYSNLLFFTLFSNFLQRSLSI